MLINEFADSVIKLNHTGHSLNNVKCTASNLPVLLSVSELLVSARPLDAAKRVNACLVTFVNASCAIRNSMVSTDDANDKFGIVLFVVTQ